jgi:phosphonate transport system permease protein
MAQKDSAMINPHPNPWFRWNCSVCWVTLGLLLLTILSFWTLDLQLERLFSVDSAKRMGRFLGELLSPDVRAVFLYKLWIASIETLAMSAVGTILAAFLVYCWRFPQVKAIRVIRHIGAFCADSYSMACAPYPNSYGQP